MPKSVEGLHVITPTEVDADVLAEVIEAEPSVVQYRDNDATSEEFLDKGSDLRKRLKNSGILFVVNDKVLESVRLGADGVHVGQSDMPADKVARHLQDGMIFGVSVETPTQALRAQKTGAAYVGFSVNQSTFTKPDAVGLGLPGLLAVAKAIEIPTVGIGGITSKNIAEVINNGAKGVAVAGAILRAEKPGMSVRELGEFFM